MTTVKKAADCCVCYRLLIDENRHCPDHEGGKDYNGYDVYNPSEWVQSVVGKKYRCPLLFDGAVFTCTGYDPRAGFWMQQDDKPEHIRNISERAIGRTYHPIR